MSLVTQLVEFRGSWSIAPDMPREKAMEAQTGNAEVRLPPKRTA